MSRSGADNETKIGVERQLDDLRLPGLVLRASRNKAPNIEGTRWPPGLAWTILDRLGGTGARKGRTLAIWQGGQPIAACSWHIEDSGPIYIFDLGCRSDVKPELADRACGALMLCLRDIAEALGRSTDELRWTDKPLKRVPDKELQKRHKREVRQRAEQLEFEPHRPRPKWLQREWVAARRF